MMGAPEQAQQRLLWPRLFAAQQPRKAAACGAVARSGVLSGNHFVKLKGVLNEETSILEEESRSKMSEKAKDPEVIAKKFSHKPIYYEKFNRLTEDFGKCFLHNKNYQLNKPFGFIYLIQLLNVPGEPPKVSLVNASLKKLKFHLTQFDSVVKKRTTPNALEEGEWGFKNTKTIFNNEIIPFLKSLKDIFNVFDKDLLNEIMEVQTVFDQMEVAVQQSSIDKQCLEIAKKEILLENDRLLQKIMSQDVMLTVMNSMSLNNDSVNMEMQKYYLKTTSEQANTLGNRRIKLNAKQPLDIIRTFACKYATRIQELLVYVQDTYPNAITPSPKKVAITPMNKVKKVRSEVFY
ncbi:hypothetical protein Tco_1466895 [Tanacetum coccineum]